MTTLDINRDNVTTESDATRAGLSFTVSGSNVTLTSITKDATCTADEAYLYYASDADSGVLQATTTWSSNVATFNTLLSGSNAVYFVMAGKNDASAYDRTYDGDGVAYPYSNNDISINGFVILDSGGLQTNNYRNIWRIITTAPVNYTATPSALTLSTTAQTPTLLFTIAPSAFALSLSLKTVALDISAPFYNHVVVASGSRGTRAVRSSYPKTVGTTFGTTKTDKIKMRLEPSTDLRTDNQKI